MNIQAQFRAEVRSQLEPLTASLIPVLQQLILHPYPPEMVSLEFEVFCERFTTGFPVRAFFMDAERNECCIGRLPADPDLLTIEQVYSPSVEEKYTELDETLDLWTAASEVLIGWFSDCWMAAGGARFPLQAHIGLHDEIHVFDLIRQEWKIFY
ncbi:MAG TPA: hypothetical protein VHP83_16065 [Aggregatilineaceae bacterium]|nr:hypothetical protein [Aggregatilineaceae bacterium]